MRLSCFQNTRGFFLVAFIELALISSQFLMSSPQSQPSARSPQGPDTEKAPLISGVVSTPPLARSPQNAGTERAASNSDVAAVTLENSLEWALKVLGFAAACIFGAWAPLSYKAALDGNSGNDAGQSSMISAAVAANSQAGAAASQQSVALDAMISAAAAASSQASAAASQQSVALDAVISTAVAASSQASAAASQQSEALNAMNSRISAIGQLWLYDFCISQTVRPHVLWELKPAVEVDERVTGPARRS
jgi:hypothetical protein